MIAQCRTLGHQWPNSGTTQPGVVTTMLDIHRKLRLHQRLGVAIMAACAALATFTLFTRMWLLLGVAIVCYFVTLHSYHKAQHVEWPSFEPRTDVCARCGLTRSINANGSRRYTYPKGWDQ